MNTPQPKHRKPRLGRGLSSLIVNSAAEQTPPGTYSPVDEPIESAPAVPVAPAGSAVTAAPDIPIDQIAPNPYQPRRDFDDDALARLAESIATQGLLQPLIVTPAPDGHAGAPYLLVAGERRLRAARLAGISALPCIVRQATSQQMLEWAMIENIHRLDLNPIERARAYRQYMDRFNLTQAQAGERLGQPRATVANYLRLLELCDPAQVLLAAGRLSFGHAKVLAGLIGKGEHQAELARRVVEEDLSVRQLEALLASEAGSEAGSEEAPTIGRKGPRAKAPYLRDLEDRLSQAVGTRVQIRPGRAKNTGRVVIEYYSLDDFDGIAERLGVGPGD